MYVFVVITNKTRFYYLSNLYFAVIKCMVIKLWINPCVINKCTENPSHSYFYSIPLQISQKTSGYTAYSNTTVYQTHTAAWKIRSDGIRENKVAQKEKGALI